MQITPQQLQHIKLHALSEAAQHAYVMLLDNHNSTNACGLQDLEFAFATGATHLIEANVGNAFDALQAFHLAHPQQWLFGFLAYDLKNEIERLQSNHPDGIGFPDLCFFIPDRLVVVDEHLQVREGTELVKKWLATPAPATEGRLEAVYPQQRVSRAQYLQDVEKIRNHILEGDVYELNYCVEFFAPQVIADPFLLYKRLSEKSPVPFGGFVKVGDKFLMCASPERFLKRRGHTLYAQPIKGTKRRGANSEEDALLKQQLLHSEKERAENLMIVDLVRNDLARSSETGTVKVQELFGIYTFPQVHQMISTITSVQREALPFTAVIQHAFPMGSMTGAPKIKAMELIEKYERTRRGLYSGAIGYIAPNGDFDFNVVIRSIQYNRATGYLSFEVGGAITIDSVAEQEYEECLLKAQAIMQVLKGDS